MLHELLTANRHDLIRRCMRKANRRDLPLVASSHLEHGVPIFVEQLVDALRREAASGGARRENSDSSSAVLAEGGRTAALHGKALLEEGCSVEQVVHGYGDICQAITELAKEENSQVTVEEFHTLNRLLDNAIADALSSYGRHREAAGARGTQDMQERMGSLAEQQRRLLNIALKALDAIKFGDLGLKGATEGLLEDSLMKLRDLIDKSLPEIRLSSGMTTTPDLSYGKAPRG
jgi:hypothetical protein